MGWIGFTNGLDNRFDLRGLGQFPSDQPNHVHPDTLLPRGSLTVETRLSPDGRPQTLLAFHRTHPWSCSFSLQALPGGGFILIESQMDGVRHATLPHQPDGRMDMVRLTYSWDAPAKWGRVSLERPETDSIHTARMTPPHPMPLSDLKTMLTDQRQREMDDDVEFVALSDQVEPLGPMPGLTGCVPVCTPDGYLPAAHLRRGDLVLTETGKTVPVLQAVRRTVPAHGSFRPVRLRAPYFGLRRDIVVAPHQRLVIRGTQVEYTFGREAVLVPARHLINGVSAFYANGPDEVTYHQLLLPGHEEILAAGCSMESLYIGRLRRKPDQLSASLLARIDRSRLPEHAKPVWPVLKPFEAISLAISRAA